MTKGGKYKLPDNGFTPPTDKVFDKWTVDGTDRAPGDELTVNSDLKVTAKWKDKPIDEKATVSFDANGGTGTMDPVEVTKGGKYKLPDNGFTPPTDKVFDKWTVDGTDRAPGDELTVNGDLKITAQWKDKPTGEGCYIATSVYGSYDSPEVWTLRRYRDEVLSQTWYGRLFIKTYYAISPTLVRLFGGTDLFQDFWRGQLDSMVESLQDQGFESTPYQDLDW